MELYVCVQCVTITCYAATSNKNEPPSRGCVRGYETLARWDKAQCLPKFEEAKEHCLCLPNKPLINCPIHGL